MKKYIFTEEQIKKVIDNMINEQSVDRSIDEDLDYQSFYEDGNLEDLRNAIDANRLLTVLFVKKDGSIKHMLIKKFLKSYVKSEAPKTELQQDIFKNNNLKAVIDMGAYRKELRDMRAANPEMDDAEIKKIAGDKAWRRISLPNVLGFLVGGKFIDLRDENQIMERFGEEVYNSLTPSMVAAINRENQGNEVEVDEQSISNKFNVPATSNKVTIPSGTTSTKAWDGLKARLKSAYYYTEENPNKLICNFEKFGTAVVTYVPSEANPAVGTMAMEIKFNDPNIVKQNGASIAKIQSLLGGAKFVDNALVANKPQGYLTQNINSVANMLFNVIKFNGKTFVNTPSDEIIDRGVVDFTKN